MTKPGRYKRVSSEFKRAARSSRTRHNFSLATLAIDLCMCSSGISVIFGHAFRIGRRIMM